MELFWYILSILLTILAFAVPPFIMIILLIVPVVGALLYFPEQLYPYILIGPWVALVLVQVVKKMMCRYTMKKKAIRVDEVSSSQQGPPSPPSEPTA